MKRLFSFLLTGLIFNLVLSTSCIAVVTLPAIFGDHMVLQQEAKVTVWGTAGPGENIVVTVGDHHASTNAMPDGSWKVELEPFPNGSPATTMTVTAGGGNTLTFQDVLIGDTWLCSGQSNMAYSMNGFPADTAKANDPQLRFFVVGKRMAMQPQADLEGNWIVCTPETAKLFSAVGYFFGRELRAHLSRPVGLIGSYWDGSTAQCWTSLSGLQKDPPFQRYLDVYQDNARTFDKDSDHYEEREAAYIDAMNKWNAAGNNVKFGDWCKLAAEADKEKKPAPPQDFPPMPSEPHMPGGNQRNPANCFNAMISPLMPYAIKGVIWYQGEYNCDDPMEYYDLLPRLITDWRSKWGQGDFPFLIVQLPALWLKNWDRVSKSENWDPLREAQLKALSLPNTGLAVTIDVGGDLHPPGKVHVGHRLALVALHQVYGDASIAAAGPMYALMKINGGAIQILFAPNTSPLTIGSSPMPDTAELQPKDKLGGFQIAGADGKWVEADARIDSGSVVVSSPQIPSPVAVRYGWGNGRYDVECNLYNQTGLPASPFRTDDWGDVVPVNTRLSPGMIIKPAPSVAAH